LFHSGLLLLLEKIRLPFATLHQVFVPQPVVLPVRTFSEFCSPKIMLAPAAVCSVPLRNISAAHPCTVQDFQRNAQIITAELDLAKV